MLKWFRVRGLLSGAALFFSGLLAGLIFSGGSFSANSSVMMLRSLNPFRQKNANVASLGIDCIGLTRNQMIERFGIERVLVCRTDEVNHHMVFGGGGGNRTDFSDKFGEIWLLPHMKSGISNYTSVCFNHSGEVAEVHVSEWIEGFPLRMPGAQ